MATTSGDEPGRGPMRAGPGSGVEHRSRCSVADDRLGFPGKRAVPQHPGCDHSIAAEHDRYSPRAIPVERVDCLEMYVRLGAVARVAAGSHRVAQLDPLPSGGPAATRLTPTSVT